MTIIERTIELVVVQFTDWPWFRPRCSGLRQGPRRIHSERTSARPWGAYIGGDGTFIPARRDSAVDPRGGNGTPTRGFAPDASSLPNAAMSEYLKGVSMSTFNLWKRFQQYLCHVPSLGLTLDVSRMRFEDGFLQRMAGPMQQAFEAMDALERGEIANPDENRMVGHYWLRARNWRRRRKLPPRSVILRLRSNSLPARCTKAHPDAGRPAVQPCAIHWHRWIGSRSDVCFRRPR